METQVKSQAEGAVVHIQSKLQEEKIGADEEEGEEEETTLRELEDQHING